MEGPLAVENDKSERARIIFAQQNNKIVIRGETRERMHMVEAAQRYKSEQRGRARNRTELEIDNRKIQVSGQMRKTGISAIGDWDFGDGGNIAQTNYKKRVRG